MTKKTWLVFSLTIVFLMTGMIYMSKTSGTNIDVSNVDINKVQAASVQNGQIADHVYSVNNSKVILVEYGDFECPACGNENTNIMKIAEDYKDKITFIFRNYPLSMIHANAEAAAAAAEAAGLQGKYWQMHELLYKNQDDWNNLPSDSRTNKFVDYAKSLGLNVDQFRSDMSLNAVTQKINYDLAEGRKANVSGTPTFVLNGTEVDSNTWSDDAAFRKLIDSKL